MKIEVTHQDMYEKGYREGYAKAMEEHERQDGEWRDYSDEGYIECPFCEHATNCDDNIEELHYCFFCGASLRQPCPCDTCQTAIDRCGCQMHLCSKYQKWKEGVTE